MPERAARRSPRQRVRRPRRRRCACGDFATRTLRVCQRSAAGSRGRRLTWIVLDLCEACYTLEKSYAKE